MDLSTDSPAVYLASIGSQADPAKTAFSWRGQSLSYGDLSKQVESLASELGNSFNSHDLVAAWLPNGPDMIRLCLATFRNGMTAMPLNAETSKPELIAICQRARLQTLVTDSSLAASLSESDLAAAGINRLLVIEGESVSLWVNNPTRLAVVENDSKRARALADTALVIHTSGSSGFPKGVVLSQRALQHIIEGRIQSARISSKSEAVVASCLSHSVGLYQVLAYLQAGASFVLLESYEIEALLHTINARRPSHLIMVVSAFQALLVHPEVNAASFQKLEFASVGADRVPAELQQRFYELTGQVLAVSYGMTELSWIMINDLNDPERSVALGRPTAGVEVQLRDPNGRQVALGQLGEIVARSPKAMSGYLAADGTIPLDSGPEWIYSGDLASCDADGVYWFGGRIKDLIVLSSGDVVAPAEIEQATLRLDGVEDCIALGISMTQAGLGNQVTEPWLVITSAHEDIRSEDVIEHLRQQLSPHKLPRKVVFQSSLPTSITGKVSRQQLARYLRRMAKL
jgi:long-chain acyl-CoA synthetase